jgi:hypothetical protein
MGSMAANAFAPASGGLLTQGAGLLTQGGPLLVAPRGSLF